MRETNSLTLNEEAINQMSNWLTGIESQKKNGKYLLEDPENLRTFLAIRMYHDKSKLGLLEESI